MDALLVEEIPTGAGWQYEPKWDGFRCLFFRDGKNVYLQSKSGQPLTRYFPELVDAFLELGAKRFVLDGEIAIPIHGKFSFDDLLQRIHPAASRVRKLSFEHPALFIVFDLLAGPDGRSLLKTPLRERRELLEKFARDYFAGQKGSGWKLALKETHDSGERDQSLSRRAGSAATRGDRSLRLSPATTDFAVAQNWFKQVGGDLDGIVAKRLDCDYRSGERTGMEKVKLSRTADCVIGGFRYAAKQKVVGSLLLGLYNDAGLLDHVGFCSGLKADERKQLLAKLKPLISPPGFTGHAPGGLSRWSTKRSMEWEPLKPKLVVEVSYDHFTGGRFRHGTRLIRWRPDKAPAQCTMEQVAAAGRGSLALLQEAA
jgi:ATP-dependent DNA ligase